MDLDLLSIVLEDIPYRTSCWAEMAARSVPEINAKHRIFLQGLTYSLLPDMQEWEGWGVTIQRWYSISAPTMLPLRTFPATPYLAVSTLLTNKDGADHGSRRGVMSRAAAEGFVVTRPLSDQMRWTIIGASAFTIERERLYSIRHAIVGP